MHLRGSPGITALLDSPLLDVPSGNLSNAVLLYANKAVLGNGEMRALLEMNPVEGKKKQ
jgi:hypothetical protein